MEISNVLNYALIGVCLFSIVMMTIIVFSVAVLSIKVYQVTQEEKLVNKYKIQDELTPEEYKILKKLDKRG